MENDLKYFNKVMEKLKKHVDKEKEKELRIGLKTLRIQDINIKKQRKIIHIKHEYAKKLINTRINNNQKKRKKKNQNQQYDGDVNSIFKEINEKIYKNKWSRLHSELKFNRILHYIKYLKHKYNLNQENTKKLKEQLTLAINKKKINKNDHIDYDEENGKILSIYNLEYDKIQNTFTLH